MNTEGIQIKRALISVSDKSGIVELGKGLKDLGIEIISTGGTAAVLTDRDISVTDVSDVTGVPELMNGRIKTLHPKIHGAILGLRDKHGESARENDIAWIDLVVCNLYPFAETVSKEDVNLDRALENIDIGGPSMIRSAAKNVGWAGIVVDPKDYGAVLGELKTEGGLTFETRKRLSAKAFGHTARYDALIYNHLNDKPMSDPFTVTFDKHYDLRYGENPHQKAAAFRVSHDSGSNVLNAKIHQGKKLSYNNILDADEALACLREFSQPACVVVKHANPCGVATGSGITDCFTRGFEADSLSAFGGIIALNRTCTSDIAEFLRKVFIEIVLAPDYEREALEIFSTKKKLRVLEVGEITPPDSRVEFKFVDGGLLVQETNISTLILEHLNTVTEAEPTEQEIEDMLFAWKVLKHVKSNAILTAKDHATVGIGPGQVSRVDAVEIAIRKSGDRITGAVLASDAFFPFRDSIDMIADSGLRAVIQPGGSIRDQEVIDACDEHGLAMVFTGTRCFKH
ncbi:MAG: bifunctional phosphoribosylaminoimidazolecarboxamide formyltransferase/IMP cyclohydrolase [Candidatus Neomarinimicrobiota bacterium]